MSEVLLPTWIIPEEETQEWLDEGSVVFPSAFAPGIAQRQSYGGLRLKLSRRHTVRGEEKAQLLSILNLTRGRYNALRTKVHFALRGSGLGSEVLTNNTFANGTTGWTQGSQYSLSVADRVMRCRRTAVTISGIPLAASSAAAVTQYAPYVLRAMLMQGRGNFATGFDLALGSTTGASDYAESTNSAAYGMHTLTAVAPAATMFSSIRDLTSSGLIAGDHLSVPYISLSGAPLVDNWVNGFLRSDEFDNAAWTKTRSSVTADATTAPDGTSTADQLTEDATASNTHRMAQNFAVSAATNLDYCVAFSVKANTRTWAYVFLEHATGSASAWINLSTGALGSVSPGTNWTLPRAFVVDEGNGWYRVYLVARKTSAATSITGVLGISTGDSVQSYSGDGTSSIYGWRGAIAQSALPMRAVQTVASAATGTSQTGNGLYIKSAFASAAGLLLQSDWFEMNGELKQTSWPLNTDAAGLGYLQFEPALVRSPANDDPVIVTDPMGKFLVSNIKVDNRFGQHAIVTYDLEHIYE